MRSRGALGTLRGIGKPPKSRKPRPFVPSDAVALGARLRAELGEPWTVVKKLIATGKVFVDGERVIDAGRRVVPAQSVEVRHAAPRPRDPRREIRVVHEDPHLVIIDKPSGISSVPYEAHERGTAMDLLRDAWRRMGRNASGALHIVHRIDKDTSGLLAFAKSKLAERGLAMLFRTHDIDRSYLCVAHGRVAAGRIESRLIRDRGDGLRGSTRSPEQGKRAVTHVEVVRDLGRATLCRVTLETGKTHQIRIHLSERGHPLVGERVYVRDFLGRGGVPLPSPRLLLHAATLGFVHPLTAERLRFESEPPGDFQAALAGLEADR